MIPFILSIVGGYLIGDSMKSSTFADGGVVVGKRVRLIKMNDDPNPVTPGTMGTIAHIGGGVINVKWDDGRYLGLVEGVDEYEMMADGGRTTVVDVIDSSKGRPEYDYYEMVVISKELEKDGGKNHVDRYWVSARNINEAKEIATKMWKLKLDNSDLSYIEAMSADRYKMFYLNK